MNGISRVAKKRIATIYEKAGSKIDPEIVLSDAKKPTSPLHKYFEWDNEKAGHLYRLTQARELIAYCVDVETGGREYVYIPSREAFVATADLVKTACLWREAVETMEREIVNLIASKERTMAIAPKPLQVAFGSFKKASEAHLKRMRKAAKIVV